VFGLLWVMVSQWKLKRVMVSQWKLKSGGFQINEYHCMFCLVEFCDTFLFQYTVCFGNQCNVMKLRM
jgi:hypothetical protein